MPLFDYDEYQSKITPVVVAFIVYDIVGFFGNSLVLFIYGTRYPRTHFRLLVLALSLVDFTSCCTTVPLETVSSWYYFDPPSRGLCKAKNFFVQLTGLSAMYMLFVTAVYKFRKICNPFKKQISQKFIIILCCSGITGSLLCAIPAAILWDINKHTATENNDTDHAMSNITVTYNNRNDFARICEVHVKFHDTLWPSFYRHLLSAYDLFLLATIALYFFVAKTTIVHYRHMKNAKETNKLMLKYSSSFSSKSSTSNLNIKQTESEKRMSKTCDKVSDKLPEFIVEGCGKNDATNQLSPITNDNVGDRPSKFIVESTGKHGATYQLPSITNDKGGERVPEFIVEGTGENDATNHLTSKSSGNDDDRPFNFEGPGQNNTNNKLSPVNSNSTTQTTPAARKSVTNHQTQINIRKVVMMVIIAGTFSVTFLMALTFGYVFAVRDFQDYSSVSEYITLFTCYRFYFINYAMNPVVYFSFDRRFRKEVIKLIRPTCR